MLRRLVTPCLALLLVSVGALRAQTISITPDDASGTYEPGEVIRWEVTVTNAASLARPTYTIKTGGLDTVASGDLSLTDGRATIESSLDTPGWLLLEVTGTGSGNAAVNAFGGAVVALENIVRADERPADFDAFWDGKLAELATVPINAVETPGTSDRAGVDYSTVTLDVLGDDQVQGQLARPSTGDTFPALLIVQWAGVYSLQKSWATSRAAQGWLVLNTQAHDVTPIESDAFYQALNDGELSGYWRIGNEDRETSYFLRMYLACHRAAEYLANRPDWDGRTLVVMGASQGGLQAIVTAGLHPQVTAALGEVPAGSDQAGLEAGRVPGWPQWAWQAWDRDLDKVMETARYFDVTNFAARIKAPVLMGAGLLDDVVPPSSVFTTHELLTGAKQLVVMPLADHQDNHGPYYAVQERWLDDAKAGREPVITVQPQPVTARTGESVFFSVAAGQAEALGYQWFKDGEAIGGATGSAVSVAGVTAADAGSYVVRVTSPGGAVTSTAAALTLAPSVEAGDGPHLANISTRCYVGTGSAIGVAGFVLERETTVLIRGIGPSLTAFQVDGALQRPVLRLFDGDREQIAENQGWKSDPAAEAELVAAMQRLGAFAPSSDDDSILRVTLPAGLYSAQVSGAGSTTGNALIEVYAEPDDAGDDFLNLSSRCYVGTGASVAVAGLVLREESTVVIRAAGPSLGAFGVEGTLRKPLLTLYDRDGVVIARNFGWAHNPMAAKNALAEQMHRMGAFAFSSPDDSALVITLPAGPYTAEIAGVNATAGNGLVEIYLVR
ncbi:acetylxylan esterase [Synoicihabitans lomoniglobus]|uniref:Acetylxylan esterase n=1 Tax=Synoicihabitans lomoniglobus TaxID=2909285 RepID=A0AAF0CHR2_9BACT|nr:acetylxylan esterase [Opitutaceae bacterium LMO-M01]WED64592.1 acetylxylan esterase [Opitutaceae bacterium LMO-M01]